MEVIPLHFAHLLASKTSKFTQSTCHESFCEWQPLSCRPKIRLKFVITNRPKSAQSLGPMAQNSHKLFSTYSRNICTYFNPLNSSLNVHFHLKKSVVTNVRFQSILFKIQNEALYRYGSIFSGFRGGNFLNLRSVKRHMVTYH